MKFAEFGAKGTYTEFWNSLTYLNPRTKWGACWQKAHPGAEQTPSSGLRLSCFWLQTSGFKVEVLGSVQLVFLIFNVGVRSRASDSQVWSHLEGPRD